MVEYVGGEEVWDLVNDALTEKVKLHVGVCD